MSELEVMFPNNKKIKLTNGKEVEILKIELGHLPTVLKFVEKYFALEPKQKKNPNDFKVLILQELRTDFDSVIELLECLTSLAKTELKKLDLADATIVVSEVIIENADFLQQTVVPSLSKVVDQLKGIGSNKSKS